jgi:glutamate dehydrogenase
MLETVVGRYRDGIAAVEASLPDTLLPQQREHVDRRAEALVGEGAPAPLAVRVASFPALVAAPDIVLVANRTGRPIAAVAATHFAVAARFRLAEIALAARDVPVTDHYDRLALDGALATIETAHRALTTEVVGEGEMSGIEAVDAWARRRGAAADRLMASVEAIAGSGLTLSKLTVAASLLGDLARR